MTTDYRDNPRSRFRNEGEPTVPTDNRSKNPGRRADDYGIEESWHLHKATTLTIIGFIFGLCGMVMSAFLDNKNDLAVIHANEAVTKEQIKALNERDDRLITEMKAGNERNYISLQTALSVIHDQYKDLSARLDRVVEWKRATK